MKNGLNWLLNRSRNIGLLRKFILFYLFTIFIPVIIIYYVSYTNTVNLIKREIQTSLSGMTVQVNNNLEDWLMKIDGMTSTMYSSVLFNTLSKDKYGPDSLEFVQDHREFDKFFMYVLTQSNDIASIFVFTKNKNLFYKSYAGAIKSNYDPEEEDWYSRTLNNKGKTTFFGLHRSWLLSNGSSDVFSFAREIRNIEGEHIGVLLVDIKLDSIGRLIGRAADSYDSKFLVIDNNGSLIYRDRDIEFQEDDQSLLDRIASSDDQPAKVVVNSRPVHLTTQTSAISGWKIVSVTPDESINKHTLNLSVFYGVITVVSIFIFSFMLLLLYLTIYRPIYRLNLSMKKVEAGDFNVQVLGRSKDEIGQLNASFNQMVSKVNELIESEYKATILRKDAEFKALQAQINPHFLYNTLQLISSIAVVKKVPEIDHASRSLGYMLRYSIKTKGDFVPFEQELEHVKSYLDIQSIRLEDEVRIKVQMSEELKAYGIVKLVLQPIIENSFRHGLDKRRGAGTVELLGRLTHDDKIEIAIRDNGAGMDQDTLDRLRRSLGHADVPALSNGKESIGILNVDARLKLFYGANYRLSIRSAPGEGTEVVLLIPAVRHQGGWNDV